MPNLVGIGLSQVPTNSMLGGLAYQDPEHASIKDLDLKNLSQINSEIADTAGDIFLYDTSKDSDGGAWRYRTQHTSWYNETLGTVRRGTRKEFPAVAVIVAENDALAIYDGDDPDLPMWMKWTTTTMLRGNAARALAAKNGIIAITNASTYGGLVEIYFVSDTAKSYRALGSNNNSEGYWIGPGIASRDDYSSNNYSNNSGGNTLPALASEYTNDVAMTVLPNAAIDETTGLPIPTVAVATNNGVSVIKDDETVVDLRGDHGGNYNKSTFVDFDSKTNAIISGFNYGTADQGVYKLGVFPIPSADRNDDNSYTDYQHHYRRIQTGGNATIPKLAGNHITDAISAGGDGRYAIQTTASGGNPTALNIIQEDPGTDGSTTTYPSNSRIAYATTSYNTGWMHGDIKGAFLSDTDTTNVTGEKIDLTNGSIPAGNNASVASITANQLVFQSSNETVGRYDTGTTLVTGKQYHATLTISNYSGSGDLGVASGGGFDATFRYSANGTYTKYITGDDTNEVQLFYRNTNSATIGLTIKETDIDRSVNNKGLEVRGTISKQVVATGADLVSYGPFNNSNNLRQPYNSDLRFGTGDFYIMFWVYDSGVNQHCTLISRDEREFDISRLASAYGNKLRIYTRNSSEDLRAPDSTSALPQNEWVCVCVVYTGGNTKKVYLDGVLDRTITGTDGEYDIDSTSYGMTIGARTTNGVYNYSADGIELALMRISGSALSAAQVKKIYNDEKHLFEENAKATLYGSSDAVTALAYDEVTEQLHVGTSSGRSDFQGLRRINNTTTAVTTAISAHDEFIVEQ